jgi:two-component system sensor histidine kinase VicK
MHPNAPSFAFLGALTETIDQVVFAFGTETPRVLYLNPAFEAVFAQKRETLDPGSLLGSVHAEDQEYVSEAYQDLLAGHARQRMEFRVLLPDGSERWLRVKSLLIEENGTRAIAGLAEDITESKHSSAVELKYCHKKNAIIQMLSHELAGPLGTIQALSSLLANRVKGYRDESLTNVVGVITETSRDGLRLIRDFLRQEFLESSGTALVKSRVNLTERLGHIIEQYQIAGQNTARRFCLSSSSPSVYADVDEIKFFQVITNLVSNAIKFTPDDGTISICVDERAAPGKVRITIRDNGIGIPRQYHTALFDKFTKAGRPGLRQEPTTGLGLSIVKTIIEWHRGSIWFESEENEGTAFHVEVPKA